ncbi:MAG: hypothetical protein V4719_19330 [Planctomycetota bacterium]
MKQSCIVWLPRLVLLLAVVGVPLWTGPAHAEDLAATWTQKDQDELLATQTERIKNLTVRIAATPKSTDLYSKRGDAYFFLGDFDKSLADYEQMVQLDESQAPGHWRRGIADFYAGKFKAASDQFELYHSFDDVDRENGIWRYLSQVKAYGRDKAREGLLKYKKDDREPFPDVYQLFAGKLTAEQILQKIREAKVDTDEREKRLFYAELYIGLNFDVEKEPRQALEHLRAATATQWPRQAGYGPHYMWHVGRLHALQLQQQLQKQK